MGLRLVGDSGIGKSTSLLKYAQKENCTVYIKMESTKQCKKSFNK